ncbi:enoyl-ACP reductase FabI [Kitasatospora sp. NBC_01560]|uniref:enoyl-ACP reductase FabI n=1 Tax=Kitasatospora sp. NBC_01560 TaxID=2975965 RepID=UPI003866FC32
MGDLLRGKRLLVTGVITESSIAFEVARLAQLEGAQVVLTGFGRLSLVERVAARLPEPAPVVELDVTDPAQLASLAERVGGHLDGLDGVVHSIAFAPPAALGGNFLTTEWPDVSTAMHVSAYSLKSLATAALPLMAKGSSIVGLTFDARFSWPNYDWMGVSKAALEATSRYLARDLGGQGIRCNLVAAGPIKTMAARSIPGYRGFEEFWDERAPVGWDPADPEPAARGVVALLSDWFPRTTGEIVHVDGGVHAIGT